MEIICPNCNNTIDPSNINIGTDLAKCGNCNSILKASELINTTNEKELLTPPSGARIQMQKGVDSSFEIFYPKKGFTLANIPMLFFAVFWLGFISFWSWGASQASIIFALFSIPFWLIGFSMVIAIINSINESQTIKLSADKLVLIKQRPINSKTTEYFFDDIQSIKLKQLKTSPFMLFGNFRQMLKLQGSFGAGIELPAIITGKKTDYFFEDANDAEQEWITKFLGTILKKRKNNARQQSL